MKIFITGGTGFIGFPLVKKLLERDYQLMVLSRKSLSWFEQYFGREAMNNIRYVQGDVSITESYEEAVSSFKPELVYHLAWEGIPDHGPLMSSRNLQQGLRLLEMVAPLGCRAVICTGSCWEYGTSTGGLNGKLNEEALAVPRDSFTAAKTALRLVGQDLAKEKKFDFIWARPFYVYGPRQREKSLIPSIISSVQKGNIPELRTPFSRNDFSYVEDVAAALCSFAEFYEKNPSVHVNGIYNIGSGVSAQVQEIVQKVCRYFGRDYSLRTDLPEKIVDFWSDNSKLEKLTGWKPKTCLEEGIKEMCHLFQERERDTGREKEREDREGEDRK